MLMAHWYELVHISVVLSCVSLYFIHLWHISPHWILDLSNRITASHNGMFSCCHCILGCHEHEVTHIVLMQQVLLMVWIPSHFPVSFYADFLLCLGNILHHQGGVSLNDIICLLPISHFLGFKAEMFSVSIRISGCYIHLSYIYVR